MKIFHKITSAIFQPLLICTFAMIWLMTLPIFDVFTIQYKLSAIIGTFILTGILPGVPILVMIMRGNVSDIFISNKKQRTIPYMFSFLSYLLWSVFLWRSLGLPGFIAIVGVSSAISILIIMIINLKWKISAHLCSVGGMFAFIIGVSYKMAINPLGLIIAALIISALVGISRVELKAHTPSQALCGFIVGFICIIIPTLLA